ncbi:MAG TPA: hypothetical protein VD948_12620 [Rhodothermales bacterium]|nr:hypothetical protein [Rhodothermales bacterium]
MWNWLARRQIEHYEAEIRWLRAELRYEKARADRMYDRMLSRALGEPVTTALPAPPPEQPATEIAEDVQRLLQSAEFTQAGHG